MQRIQMEFVCSHATDGFRIRTRETRSKPALCRHIAGVLKETGHDFATSSGARFWKLPLSYFIFYSRREFQKFWKLYSKVIS